MLAVVPLNCAMPLLFTTFCAWDGGELATAVQDALSKGAIGIVSVSPLFFLADKAPNQQGVPVTGGFFDGPEWGTKPFTNMFASDVGSVDPKYPVNTSIGAFMKAHGGTVLCSYGYAISPSSTRSAVGTVDSFQHAGGKEGVLDTSLPFGSVAMTTPADAIYDSGIGLRAACGYARPRRHRRSRPPPGRTC